MHEKNLKFLKCVKCSSKLSLEILQSSNEIDEGFLICTNCKTVFPIIQKIPIIVEDFLNYIENRYSLGGKLYNLANSINMKKFIKDTLSKIKNPVNDQSLVEERWSEIYKLNRNSSFYTVLKRKLSDLPSFDYVLEFGSSIGIISNFLRKKHNNIFGVDISFSATHYAKKISFENSDFFVADALNHPFRKKKFDLILAINMLEVIEPSRILEKISSHVVSGYTVLSDPYDYMRGKNTVNFPLYEKDVRQKLKLLGFSIINKTNIPSSVNWTLKINPRTKLIYKVDIIIGKK